MAHSTEGYQFKKTVKFLKNLRGQGTELISIYIPPGYQIAEITNKLRDEAGQAMNIKSKRTKKNVSGAIERLLGALKGYRKPPENGLAVFAGDISGDPGGGKIELFLIEPPEPVGIQTYRCDSTFFTEPLEEMLEAKEWYGLMTVDRREATFALLKGKRVEILRSMGSRVPGKHRAGGQSHKRFERLIEEAAHNWFKKVGEYASKNFGEAKVKGVVVGGPGPTKNAFMNTDYLSEVVRRKVIGTVDTSYTDEFGITEMMQKSDEILKGMDIINEKGLVNRFIKEATVGKLAAYGEREVREALNNGQVETLLLSESITMKRVKYTCPQCGEEYEKTVKGAQGEKCPKCGADMGYEEEDIIEEMAELAGTVGTAVEMISTDTPEGEQFMNGFGGIGAILRYR